MIIHKTKDSSFKEVFGEPGLFAEFLKDFVNIDILKNVTAQDIEDISERFVPLFQESKDSDTVKRINLKCGMPLYVIAIVEHESSVNYRASFKMLQYITLVLTEYEKEANKAKEKADIEATGKAGGKASSLKGFKYPPVLPIVFYDGPGSWTAETDFIEKVEMSDVFHRYIPKFEYELVSLAKYSKQDLIQFGSTLSLIMIIDTIRTADGISALGSLPPDYLDNISRNIPPHLKELLANIITVLLKKIKVPDDEIEAIRQKIHDRGITEMFAFIDNYDVQETRRLSKAEGIKQGKQEGIKLGKQEGIKQGKQEGIKLGKQEGLKQGKQEGIKLGKQEGIKQGKQEGIKQGKQEGLKQGKQEGIGIGVEMSAMIVRALMECVPVDEIATRYQVPAESVKRIQEALGAVKQ